MISVVFIALVFTLDVLAAIDPLKVNLGYGSFKGAKSGGLSRWLGMPYAKAPVGQLRFRPPQALTGTLYGVRNATSYGPICPQQGNSGGTQSEDCLSINVVRPTVVKPGAKLPVVFWINDGGFSVGDSSSTAAKTFVQRFMFLGELVIWVCANYRNNAFGFLPGKEVKAAHATNIGVRDVQFALQWVKKHISTFGGDPTKVTLWGQSSGAFMVGVLLMTNNGNPSGLYRAAVMESGTPYAWPTEEAGQPFYDDLVSQVGCGNATDTLSCLRSAPYATLKAAIDTTRDALQFTSLNLAWWPRADGDVIAANPQDLVANGKYARVPIISGNCEDEGTRFSLGQLNLTTNDVVAGFVRSTYFPNITQAQMFSLADKYPSDPAQGSPFGTGSNFTLSLQYKRIAAFQGDVAFQAPRRFFMQIASQTQNVWGYRWKRGRGSGQLGSAQGADLPLFSATPGDPLSHFSGADALIHFTNYLKPY